MKYRYTLAVLALIVPFFAFGIVQAEDIGATIRVHGDQNYQNDEKDTQATVTFRAEASTSQDRGERGDWRDHRGNENATSSEINNEEINDEQSSTTVDVEDRDISDKHRSVIARFAHSLLQIADREEGIGAEVREVARIEDESATTTESAMVKIDRRNDVATFFFGSDYKNLGVIRSELATTTNSIAHLKALLSKTTNATDTAALNAQISVLQIEQAKVDAYVTAHEDVFSLFGWFAKLFVK